MTLDVHLKGKLRKERSLLDSEDQLKKQGLERWKERERVGRGKGWEEK